MPNSPAKPVEERSWDYDILRDLVELEEMGQSVQWPAGLDSLQAKEVLRKQKTATSTAERGLLERGSQERDAKPSKRDN